MSYTPYYVVNLIIALIMSLDPATVNLDDLVRELVDTYVCTKCDAGFTTAGSLKRHLKFNRCVSAKEKKRLLKEKEQQASMDTLISEITAKVTNNFMEVVKDLRKDVGKDMSELRADVQELTLQPKINNSNQLKVMCVTANDNYFEILHGEMTLRATLDYIKGCALQRLSGDCRMLERIYTKDNKSAITYINRSRTKFAYYDENQNRVIESNPLILAKKLADNLLRTYLEGVRFFKIDPADREVDEDVPDVDPFDIQLWNKHIYELREEKYQKTILARFNIPFEAGV